jgi:hypothetical protein
MTHRCPSEVEGPRGCGAMEPTNSSIMLFYRGSQGSGDILHTVYFNLCLCQPEVRIIKPVRGTYAWPVPRSVGIYPVTEKFHDPPMGSLRCRVKCSDSCQRYSLMTGYTLEFRSRPKQPCQAPESCVLIVLLSRSSQLECLWMQSATIWLGTIYPKFDTWWINL